MAFKDFLLENQLDEATAAIASFKIPLIEAVNSYLAKTVAELDARKDDDSSTEIDFELLANMLTALKIVGNKDLRQSITKADVGYDPSSLADMFDVLSKVPDSPKITMPKDVDTFFKKVAGFATRAKKEELLAVQDLASADAKARTAALQKLKAFSTKIDQLYNTLKTAAKK